MTGLDSCSNEPLHSTTRGGVCFINARVIVEPEPRNASLTQFYSCLIFSQTSPQYLLYTTLITVAPCVRSGAAYYAFLFVPSALFSFFARFS